MRDHVICHFKVGREVFHSQDAIELNLLAAFFTVRREERFKKLGWNLHGEHHVWNLTFNNLVVECAGVLKDVF